MNKVAVKALKSKPEQNNFLSLSAMPGPRVFVMSTRLYVLIAYYQSHKLPYWPQSFFELKAIGH